MSLDGAAVAEATANEVLSGMAGGEAVAATGPVFTLELTQVQKDIRDWMHG